MLPLHRAMEKDDNQQSNEEEHTVSFDFKNDGFILDSESDGAKKPEELPTEPEYEVRRRREMGERQERNPFIADADDEYGDMMETRQEEQRKDTMKTVDDHESENAGDRHLQLEQDITYHDPSEHTRKMTGNHDSLTGISIAVFLAVLSMPVSFALYHYEGMIVAYAAFIVMISLPPLYIMVHSVMSCFSHERHAMLIPMILSLFSLMAIGFMAWYDFPYMNTLSTGISPVVNSIL